MTDATAALNPELKRLLPILVCPDCRGALAREESAFRCTACAAAFPITEGIPVFARFGSAEKWGAGVKPAVSTTRSASQRRLAARGAEGGDVSIRRVESGDRPGFVWSRAGRYQGPRVGAST